MPPHPAATEPRPAATVILLRRPFELLMVRRNASLAFMGGYWVFPGGKVEASDASPEAAARREVTEEVAIDLPAETELVPFARWITPVGLPKRYDTWFFLAPADGAPGVEDPRVDGSEIVEARWVAPATALTDGRALAFPTRHQLQDLCQYPDAEAAIAACRGREVQAILPEIVSDDGSPAVVVPGSGLAPERAPEVSGGPGPAPSVPPGT